MRSYFVIKSKLFSAASQPTARTRRRLELHTGLALQLMAKSLKCNECGVLLESVKQAQTHGEVGIKRRTGSLRSGEMCAVL